MITKWIKASEEQPDTNLPVLTGDKEYGPYYNSVCFMDGKWMAWERDRDYSMEWVETEAPVYWAPWPDPREPNSDWELRQDLEIYENEVKAMNKIIDEKPWLKSMHYIAERDAEESGLNQAAGNVCEYLVEQLGLRS